MALKMRMARAGRKKAPFYRIVVADARAPRDGKFIEKVGTYNPLLNKDSDQRVTFETELVKKWLEQGAIPSERVGLLLGQAGIIEMPKKRQSVAKAEPKAKAQQLLKDKAEKAAAAKEAEEEAKRQAEEEAKAAAEAPAEEEAAAEEAPAEDTTAEAPAEEAPAEEEEKKAE